MPGQGLPALGLLHSAGSGVSKLPEDQEPLSGHFLVFFLEAEALKDVGLM